MIKSILLSVDGSAYTDAQVKHCIEFAKAFQSKIHVVSIVDIRFFEWAVAMGTEGFVPVIPSRIYQEESQRLLESKAEAVLEKCSSLLEKEDIDFDVEKIYGPPADVICEKSHLVDLLIMGTRGEFARWESKLAGATLEAVVRQCNKPIFITPQDFERIRKIIVAYDGSDKANNALQLTGFFAAQLSIPVTVLTLHDNEQIRSKFLHEAATYLEPYTIQMETVGLPGSPEMEIVNFSKGNDFGLIIMGAFGHSRIREAILGSTTEQVMRKSQIPLMLCH